MYKIEKAKKNFPRFRINENLVNDVAEDLVKQKKINQSIEVYILNTLLYPNSENAYLKLGEAYMGIHDAKKARENFEKCLQINPANAKAKGYLGR